MRYPGGPANWMMGLAANANNLVSGDFVVRADG